MAKATQATRPCQVCRGSGVCGCSVELTRDADGHIETFRGCHARLREAFGDWYGAVAHDGQTCHNCDGHGVRPVGVTPAHKLAAAKAERRQVIAEYIAANGPICPGFGRPPHVVDPADLTADHRHPHTRGGAPAGRDNLGVLCRSCNARKSNRVRRAPAQNLGPAKAEHACGLECAGDLHVTEVVGVGSINRDAAQRQLRRYLGLPALYVEHAHPVSPALGQRPQLRGLDTTYVEPNGKRVPLDPVLWRVAWRE